MQAALEKPVGAVGRSFWWPVTRYSNYGWLAGCIALEGREARGLREKCTGGQANMAAWTHPYRALAPTWKCGLKGGRRGIRAKATARAVFYFPPGASQAFQVCHKPLGAPRNMSSWARIGV